MESRETLRDAMMASIRKFYLLCLMILFAGCINFADEKGDKPTTYFFDSAGMIKIKSIIKNHPDSYEAALDNLYSAADTMLNVIPPSVMQKEAVPPSGDKHDYMSVGPYWWPDPDSKDGLPYIRRDGQSNPERGNYDSARLKLMQYYVTTLSMAYFYSDNEAYAAKAAELIRVWFLNPSTKMNPNLNYAQAIPGRTEGRGIGIIDTRKFGDIIDSIGLIELSEAWSAKDTQNIKSWFKDYLNWLLTSNNGIDEASWYNNHGTWYDAQVVHIALFIGDRNAAEKILTEVPGKRIDAQIEPDGSQPHELKRTRSFIYSAMNLVAMFRLAVLGKKAGINLWTYESDDDRGLKGALDFLVPYAVGDKEWKYEMIKGWEDSHVRMFLLMRLASQKYNDEEYEKLTDKLSIPYKEAHPVNLLFPSIN